ncbi:YncE family protein [Sphingobium sp.]|uniref:YncE family protein n=1 Tax=Sphingobium sp. TaxID=1912891 RepID=UPI003BB676FA
MFIIGLSPASGQVAGDAPSPSPSPSPPASPVVLRIPAAEAHQGVASDGTHVYAIDNDRIGKYIIATGKRIAEWKGERALFPHMNSCTVAGRELVCAASNYPQVPQTSAVEIFDTHTLRHLRTVSLGFGPGSLTALDRHDGKCWAVYANYAGKGGEPNRDHRYTLLARLDDAFRQEAAWTFPTEILARFAPFSCSGLSWSRDGRLYVAGHDRPEIYELRLPEGGSRLELQRTIGTATPGQAIDWDPVQAGRLWSIDRAQSTMVASAIAEE